MNQWVQFDSFPKGPVTTGRICAVYGVPVDWIVRFPEFNPVTQYLDGDIVLGWQKYWIKFNQAASGKGFEEVGKNFKGRAIWEQTLQWRYYWQSGQTDIKVSNMAHHRWVFLVKEAGTNLLYVIGKPPVGAELSVAYSDKQGTVTDFTAKFQSIHRAPIYPGEKKAAIRVLDSSGNFLIDINGDYVVSVGDMVTPAISTGDFGNFNNTNF